jgi:hypothetical protein
MKTIYPEIKGYECSNCRSGGRIVTIGVSCKIIVHHCLLQSRKPVGSNHCCSEFKLKINRNQL